MDKAVSLCQLAIKAGKAAKGDALLPSIQKKQAALVLYSSLCGNNRKKKILDKCRFYQIPAREMAAERFDKISSWAGNSLAITDAGFARSIENALNDTMN